MASYHLSVKVGKAGSGGRHAEYVDRTGAYKNYKDGEDKVFSEHGNMPAWAVHDPAEFFRQSDLHERKKGSVYREFEIAIPRELSPEQRIQFVRDFVWQEIGTNHPYLWAIHNPNAAVGLGEQPHAHIMFSDRTLDGIDRDPEQFFKRYNSKSPEKGGCKKSNLEATVGARKEKLVGLRERFATLQNDHLAKHGHASRVDHRSLADQGITTRQPEKHLGPAKARDEKAIVPLLRHRGAQKTLATARVEVTSLLTQHRQEQRHDRHREFQARTTPTRKDDLPRLHERRHLRDADRAHHLLPGNAFDRLGEREARERADRVQRQRDAWRGRLTERREAWQNKPAIQADQAKPGKPIIYRWTDGKAKGYAAVKDCGNRIVPCGSPDLPVSDAKISAMLTIAQEKGWKSIKLTGTPEFRERAAQMALTKGFQLADADLSRRFSPAPSKAVNAAPAAPAQPAPQLTPAEKWEQSRLILREKLAAKAKIPATPVNQPVIHQAPTPAAPAQKRSTSWDADELIAAAAHLRMPARTLAACRLLFLEGQKAGDVSLSTGVVPNVLAKAVRNLRAYREQQQQAVAEAEQQAAQAAKAAAEAEQQAKIEAAKPKPKPFAGRLPGLPSVSKVLGKGGGKSR